MWIELLKNLTMRLISKISTSIFKLFYSQDKLINDINIRIRSNNGLVICLSSSIPNIVLYLEIDNISSYFDIEFDRAIIEIWLSQPFAKISIFEKFILKRVEKERSVYGNTFIDFAQIKYLCNFLRNTNQNEYRATLNIETYFNSPYGTIKKPRKIEYTPKFLGDIDSLFRLLNTGET